MVGLSWAVLHVKRLVKTSQIQGYDEEASDERPVVNYADCPVLCAVDFVPVVAGKEVVEGLVIEQAIQVAWQ